MKRHLVATVLLALVVQAHAQVQGQTQTLSKAATLWSSLWRNADQRAQSLLQQGHASDAAKLYTDPRRKAYAQIQAGDYAAAASVLKTLNDTEANYNRGNALAQAGDLQGALDAYDAALKTDPAHQDARHNRDLVAKALQKQKDAEKNKPQDGKSPDKPQDGTQQDKKDGNQNGQQGSKPDSKQGDQQGQPGDKPNGKPSNGQGNQPDKQPGDQPGGKPDAQPGTQQAGTPQDKPGDKEQTNQGAQSQPGAGGKNAPQPQAANDAEQARRDVNASLQPNAKNVTGDAANAQANAAKPMTEKQIAQEQWLRSIPDDPGGLLRRKFLIEHMMRQRDAQP